MSRTLVGNDVVDLADPRCVGKARDRRFMERVLTSEEAERVRDDDRPDTLLWLLWAAKEAAYKVVSKLRDRPPPFTHARFRVRLEDHPGQGAGLTPRVRGMVSWQELELPFRASIRPERIHSLAWWTGGPADPGTLPAGVSWGTQGLPSEGPAEGWRDELAPLFSAEEWGPVYAWPSAVVRLEARAELARRLDVDESRLQIVCPGDTPGRIPPVVLLDGDESPADVSLSHHRRFVAWALAV